MYIIFAIFSLYFCLLTFTIAAPSNFGENSYEECDKLQVDGRNLKAYFKERSLCTMCLTSNESSVAKSQHFERLPTFAKPSHYSIFLKPNLKTFKFDGEETITINVSERTNYLKLHSNELDIHNVSVTLNNGTELGNLTFTYDNTLEMIKINLPDYIDSQEIKLHLTFTGTHNDKMNGFYRSTYRTSTSKKNYMVSTQFESTYARKSFPCFDEPIYRAVFDVSLQVDSSLTALSNMEVVSTENKDDGTKIVRFAPTINMSSYLVAFVVGNFDYIEGKSKNGTLVRIYTIPGKKDQGEFALKVGIKALDYFNEWFDFNYPVSKMDMIAIPDFSMGAMENTGLLTFREVALLMDPKRTSVKQKSYISLVIAHEIAHQWFGNIVTHAWWNQLWLKEGFASFMEYLMVDSKYPEYNIWQQFVNDEVAAGFALDSLRSSHPIEVPIENPSGLEEIYDSITYQKSNSVLRMLYSHLGEPTFQKALRIYIKRHQYSNTVTADLWNALSEASGQNIQQMMDTWTKQIGFPFVSVSQKIEGTKRILTLSQKRFIADGSDSESPQLWHIPISISTASSKDQPKFKFLMTKQTENFIIEDVDPSEWVKLNTGTTGFYRVEYTNDMLESLLTAIRDGSLPVLDKFGIANDMFALVKAGKLDAVNFLKLIEVSINEEDFFFRSTLDSGIGALSSVLARFEDTDVTKRFNNFVIKNLEPLAAKLGWDSKQGESKKISQLRALIINRLIRSGHRPTIDVAREKFYDHYKNKTDIDPNLRNAIYSAVGKEDGAAGIEQLQNIFETVNFSEVERSCILAMVQTNDSKLLESVFDYAFKKNKIRSQDLLLLFVGAYATKVGQDFVYNYFLKNMALILEKFGNANSSLFQSCLKWSAEPIASESLAKDFENFFKCNTDAVTQSTLDRPIRQITETMRNNYLLLKRNGHSINQFLIAQQF